MSLVAAITDLTPTLTFVITCCTLLGMIGSFTILMFNRFRKNMAADTQFIVREENAPILKAQEDLKAQVKHLNDGLTATTELAIKHEGDLSGKDGLFSRVSHIEGVLSIKRIEPPGTVHDDGGTV